MLPIFKRKKSLNEQAQENMKNERKTAMNLRSLVGKKVIRMKPVVDKDVVTEKGILTTQDKVVEIPDYTFCDCHTTLIEVLDVIQDTPIVKVRVRKGGAGQPFTDGYVRAITGQYDDNNWKDVSEVVDFVDKQNAAILNERMSDFGKAFDKVFSSVVRNGADLFGSHCTGNCEDCRESSEVKQEEVGGATNQ